MSKQRNSQLVKLILTAIMVALNVILERVFAFQIESNHISLSVVTLGFAAVYLGVPHTVAVAVLGDILGAVIAPTGPYFFGFTLSNALMGLCLGLFLKKTANPVNISLAVVINKLICTMILNSIWVSVLYKGGIDAFPAYFITRIPQGILMCIVEIAVLLLIFYDKSPVRRQLDKTVKL